MSKFIFEIFSEELPATLQKKILLDYKQFCEKELALLNIKFDKDSLFIGITLNRMVLKIDNCNINEQQAKDFIEKTIKDFSKTFPRTMCYPQLEVRWIRPIRSLFACIDNNVLKGNFYGIEFIDGTYTQKFDFHRCNSCDDYENILSKEEIELDYNKRFEFVKNEIFKENNDYYNIKLIEEIAGMSEYCVEPMKCKLEEKFYVLPFELIEVVLRENQRYVVFKPNENNEIFFLIFGDKITKYKDKRQSIIKGHNKVVNARLDDALYYWNWDENIKNNKTKLHNILSNKTFIDDITWNEYLIEQEQLFNKIYNEELCKDFCNKEKIINLIWDTKLDLATGVVCEFPELQGIVGSYYFGYNFNPYAVDVNSIKNCLIKNDNSYNETDILYYYLIDRIAYIDVMYKKGKQPTGSGDKYKVKARMDDVILLLKLFAINTLDVVKVLDILKENHEIYKLFTKRYQKNIEDKFKDVKNIKKFAEICFNMVEKGNLSFLNSNLEKEIKYFQNENFMRIYKRIHGYTNDLIVNNDKQVEEKIKEILPDQNNLNSINTYLDNNKIADNEVVKQCLKLIEDRYFQSVLPSNFLDIID